MTLTYQPEDFVAIRPEIERYVAAHWAEFASDRDAFGMDVDWGLYESLCRSGKLAVITARRDRALVGYFGCVVSTHPHRKGVKTANASFLYVAPDPIRGLIVRSIFEESIKYCNSLGVKYYKFGSKNQPIIGKMLEKIGFKAVETVYSMVVSEPP